MQIPSVLSIPLHAIARGFRRMVTTSTAGSVTRYRWHDLLEEKNETRYRVFHWLGPGKKPVGLGRPFTQTPQELYDQCILGKPAPLSSRTWEVSFEDGACDYVKTKCYLGINFRRMRTALATTRSKNVLLTSYNKIPQFDADVRPQPAHDEYRGLSPEDEALHRLNLAYNPDGVSILEGASEGSSDAGDSIEFSGADRRDPGCAVRDEGENACAKIAPASPRLEVRSLKRASRKPVVVATLKKINGNPLSVGGMVIDNPDTQQRWESERAISG